jgi:hypothetical protein
MQQHGYQAMKAQRVGQALVAVAITLLWGQQCSRARAGSQHASASVPRTLTSMTPLGTLSCATASFRNQNILPCLSTNQLRARHHNARTRTIFLQACPDDAAVTHRA